MDPGGLGRITFGGAVVSFLALAACDGSTGPGGLRIEVNGRLERSLAVELVVTDDGTALDPSSVQWSAEPADAVEFPSGDRAVLLRAGNIRLVARSGGMRGERSLDVAVPPTVFFDMARDGNRDIYRVSLDGKDLVRVTDDPAVDAEPTVAAGTLVFVSGRDGNRELYATPVEGGALKRLTATAATERNPALSAGGKSLAFVRNATGIPRLWIAAADGSPAGPATGDFGGSGSIERSPTWAPSDNRLAFMSTANGTADVFVWDDGNISAAVTSDGAEVEPAWAPEGNQVVIAADREGETAEADLILVDLDTDEETRLTDRPGNEGQPAWLPDGRVVYTVFEGDARELRWLDPTEPSPPVVIPLQGEAPENPAGERSQ